MSAARKPVLTGVSPVDPGPPFEYKEMMSTRPLKEQYMQLEPKFKLVFEKFDITNKGYLTKETFPAFEQSLSQGTLVNDLEEYDKSIAKSKDCFHESMSITKVSWTNIWKDSDDHVTWEKFWGFFTSEKMLNRIEKHGLRTTFLSFHMWGVPSWQEEFVHLKPRFVEAFKKYDQDGNGFLDHEELAACEERVRWARPDITDLTLLDEQEDDKITWGEFWKFFSTGPNFPTNGDELALSVKLLEALEMEALPADEPVEAVVVEGEGKEGEEVEGKGDWV